MKSKYSIVFSGLFLLMLLGMGLPSGYAAPPVASGADHVLQYSGEQASFRLVDRDDFRWRHFRDRDRYWRDRDYRWDRDRGYRWWHHHHPYYRRYW